MKKLKTGRPKLAVEERKVPVSFGVKPEHRELLNFLSGFCNYKERASFLYDFVLAILEHEKFQINITHEVNPELRKDYKTSTANLNQIKKDLYHLAEWGIDRAPEFKALNEQLDEHIKLTKELHHATFTRMTSTPVTPDFWQKLQTAQETNNLELLPIAQALKDIQELKNAFLDEAA
jgi:hypothetical protein